MRCVEIDGRTIMTERDFHRALAAALDFGPYYGHNLDALWDRLSRDMERPVRLTWRYSEQSRQNLGAAFDRIVSVLRDAQEEDRQANLDERFEYELK